MDRSIHFYSMFVTCATPCIIHHYFTVTMLTSLTTICNICKGNLGRGAGSSAKYNTTNLIQHFHKHHSKEHTEFPAVEQNKRRQYDWTVNLWEREKVLIFNFSCCYKLFSHKLTTLGEPAWSVREAWHDTASINLWHYIGLEVS